MIRALAVAARACLAAAAVVAAIPAAAQDQKPETRHFLWEVQSMTNRVYLFGTIHAGKREWFPLPDPVEKAFTDSQVLAVEADVTNAEAMSKTTGAMSYAAPDELSKHVPPADYERLKVLLDKLHIPETIVRHMKPFAAASVVLFAEWESVGLTPGLGVDAYLLNRAKSMGKPVVELEGVQAQAELTDSLTEEEQRAAFSGTLDAIESGLTGEQMDGMVKAWQSGDAFLMLEVARRYNEKIKGARAIEEKFIWSRHEDMLKKIEGCLNRSDKRPFRRGRGAAPGGTARPGRAAAEEGYMVRQR
jgi:uncharacterized protein YbaP (TraB family)